jgi:hypothetical protein
MCELKDIEKHIDQRDDHRTMIAPAQAPSGTAAGQSKADAIFADHRRAKSDSGGASIGDQETIYRQTLDIV